ncbi:CRISPR-associated endonuclease Cas2 [Mycolicibacter longobardus]|uniref:CRISPR-associated endonuclease Cas2 n=1 Tax=Mycolicibacter longobardus TaxID=1108812 RepID=UPI000A149B98|nr:CRISPR-associated endonuclease Cas2 [Mycolicibacter longobardus]MCV7383971.1 CRISPR-associated endonuclease Cas2 [Mycolicibacter longobardus]
MTRDDVRRTLVAYDVTHDKRRNQLAKALGRYGDRIQYSVVVVDTTPAKMIRLRTEISRIINHSVDSLLLCDLGPVARLSGRQFEFEGARRPMTESDSFIV